MNIVILSFASFVLGSATWRTPPVDNGGGGAAGGTRVRAGPCKIRIKISNGTNLILWI